jgi:metallo-beta-lactamase family protein
MKITFCGAAGTVTGSCHLLELDSGMKILLDCGLYQGNSEEYKRHNRTWPFDPASIDLLVLSHAHIDHSGRIPKLVRDGFRGRIYCTPATRDLASIMLQDSAMIQESDARYARKKKIRDRDAWEPLYDRRNVQEAMGYFVGVGYNHWHKVNDAVRLIFRDAGHILGSASVILEIGHESADPLRVGFSGDIGRPDRPILRDPVPLAPVDYLLCESTYGGKRHSTTPDDEEALLRIVQDTCYKNRGKLVIPAFSIGRTQEIVYMLDRLETAGALRNIPVYVDSPLAVKATELFLLHPECYDAEILEYMQEDPNPFGFEKLHFVRERSESKKLNHLDGPCIIISASGMMQGGRIRHHLLHTADDPRNTILIVGHVARGTLGADIRDRKEEIHIFGRKMNLRAHVEIMDSFSAHADQKEILEFISFQEKNRLKEIFLVHGEKDRQELLRNAMLDLGYRTITIPEYGDVHHLR